MAQAILRKIDSWLSKPGNSKAKLAAALGYNSTATIDKWFREKEAGVPNGVPAHRVADVERVLRGKHEPTSKSH